MIMRFSGMGAGISSGFTTAYNQMTNVMAANAGTVDPVMFQRFAAAAAAKTTPPDPNGWQNTPASMMGTTMTLGERIAAMPTSTKLGIGLGAAALLGLIVMRRRAAA